jgi:Carboxypeptidase regulatory-like domain
MRQLMRLTFGVCFAALAATTGSAQTSNATLHGTLTDAGGAVLPGVTLKIEAPATGFTREAVTNTSGVYVFNFLPSGDYVVTAELSGFKSLRHANIKLEIGQSMALDLKMKSDESRKGWRWWRRRRCSIPRLPRSGPSSRRAS